MEFNKLMQVNELIKHVEPEQVKTLLDENNIMFIDVRSKQGYEAGHIPGAKSLDRGMLEFYISDGSPLEIKEITRDKNRKYIIYCNKGGQSALATKTFNDMGYANAYNLKGGYSAWSLLHD